MRKVLMLIVCVLMLLDRPIAIWSQQRQTPVRESAAREVEPGLVILVDGVGGIDMMGKSAMHSIKQSGLPHEVHHFSWSHGTGKILLDLQDTQHVLKKADELVTFINEYRAKHPNRPIYIIAKSGGTGIALFALQSLPANSIERLILLSAAVSPNFDLRSALRATRREVVSFHSHNDRFVLGWGTSKFGTIDRFYGNGAGLAGFTIPENLNEADRRLYLRLVQVPFSMRMLREGTSTGSHTSTSMPWFHNSEVIPWLR